MIVVDSSAVVHILTVNEPDERLLQTLSTESLHAPHLLDAPTSTGSAYRPIARP